MFIHRENALKAHYHISYCSIQRDHFKKTILTQNLIKIFTKRTKLYHLKIFSGKGIPPNSPSRARRFARYIPQAGCIYSPQYYPPPPCLNMDLRPWHAYSEHIKACMGGYRNFCSGRGNLKKTIAAINR